MATGAWQPWHTASTRPERTNIHLFDPMLETGPLATHFSKVIHVNGSCNAESNVDPVPETSRCFAGNSIYDPCWGVLSTRVICVLTPWSTEVVVLTVQTYTFFVGKPPRWKTITWDPRSDEPPPSAPFGPGRPLDVTKTEPAWALQLANGKRCIMVSGATYTVAGQRANYICSQTGDFYGPEAVDWVIGYPDRTRSPWDVAYLPAGQVDTETILVLDAWY